LLKPLLIWLAVLDLLGWLHFPLCFRLARHLRDRGLALAKLAGLFLPTYLSWLICFAPVLHTRTTIVMVVAALGVVNALVLVRDRHDYGSFFRRRWGILVVLELVFWGGGIGAELIRSRVPAIAFDPNWWGAEKWSDFTLLSSFFRQVSFPPLDPWLAGFPTNYYYYGHLAWATLAKLTATPPNIAYNVALAMIVALALTLSVSLGYHLFRSVGLGLILAWLVVCGGNLKPLAQLIESWLQEGHFVPQVDFWEASRAMAWGAMGLIRGSEINEFPSFSFILGDLHPHFSAHPVFLGFLLIIAALWRAGQRETFWAREAVMGRLAQWLALAFGAGLLYATNSWDCFVGLFLAAFALPFARGFRRWPAWGRSLLGLFILGLTFLLALRVLFLFFSIYFIPPKTLRLTVLQWFPPRVAFESPLALVPTALRSPISNWLFYFGLFLLPYFAWQLWGMAKRARSVPRDRKMAHLAIALAVGLLVYVHGQRGLVGILAFALVALAPSAFRRRRHDRLELVAILAWLAVLASFLCEWFYYNDNFSGRDERINTIFKVYYCLWPVAALGAVGACSALWGGRTAPHRLLRRISALLLILLLVAIGSLYPLFAWTTRIRDYKKLEIGFDSQPTLDGLKYLESLPGVADDYRAGLWLRDHASPYTTVAEATGWGYSAVGRFAAIGGVMSLLGWWQHETSWREGFGSEIVTARRQMVEELFTTTSLPRAADLLAANRVDYVAVGWLERLMYPAEGLQKFDLLGQEAFRSGGTILYAITFTRREEKPAEGGQR